MRMCHTVICGLPGSAIFFTLSHKRHDFREKKYWTRSCILIFSKNLLETILLLWRIGRNEIKNVYWSSCKVTVNLLRFLKKLEFSWQIFEKHSSIRFNENLSSGSRRVACGRTDGQTNGETGTSKPIFAFRNFANAPKHLRIYWLPEGLQTFKDTAPWIY